MYVDVQKLCFASKLTSPAIDVHACCTSYHDVVRVVSIIVVQVHRYVEMIAKLGLSPDVIADVVLVAPALSYDGNACL